LIEILCRRRLPVWAGTRLQGLPVEHRLDQIGPMIPILSQRLESRLQLEVSQLPLDGFEPIRAFLKNDL
jgi:hypothetical protein